MLTPNQRTRRISLTVMSLCPSRPSTGRTRRSRALGDVREREPAPSPQLPQPRAEPALGRPAPWSSVAVRRVPDARLDAHVALLDPLAKHQDLRVVRSGQAAPPVVVHRAGPPGEQDDEAPAESPPRSSPADDARRDATHEMVWVDSHLVVDRCSGRVRAGPTKVAAPSNRSVPRTTSPSPSRVSQHPSAHSPIRSASARYAKASAADASQSAETQWARLRSVIEAARRCLDGTRRTAARCYLRILSVRTTSCLPSLYE